MARTLTDGEREILSELEADAREGMELEGEPCGRCGGNGIEKLDPRTGEPISCAVCEGSWGGAVRLPALQESVKRQMAEVGGHVR